MIDDERIAGVGVRVVSLGKQDVGPEVSGPAPELREPLREDLFVPDVFRRRRVGDCRDDLVEFEADDPGVGGIKGPFARGRIEIPGRLAPLLAFAPVHRQLHHVPVRAVECLVAVEQRLHLVGAAGDGGKTLDRVPEDVRREFRLLPCLPAKHVDAEDLLALQARVADLEPRLLGFVGRDEKQEAAIERRRALVGAIRHDKSRPRRFGGACCSCEGRGRNDDRREDTGQPALRHQNLLLLPQAYRQPGG